jgi:hypothetical protein
MNLFDDFGTRNAPILRALTGLQASGLQEGAHGSVGNQDVSLRQSFGQRLHARLSMENRVIEGTRDSSNSKPTPHPSLGG